jgi:hypothetical protein
MLNISKCHKLIVSCSAIAATLTIGSVQIAQAQTPPPPGGTFSNGSSTNVTTTTGGGPGITTGGGGSNPGGSPSGAISGRAGVISSRVSVAQASYDTAVSNLAAAEAAQTPAADTTPVRYGVDKGVADLASCGCPNADVSSAPSTTPRPELVAAKTAEADAAAELAAAQAEARQFIESVKTGSTVTSSAPSQLW